MSGCLKNIGMILPKIKEIDKIEEPKKEVQFNEYYDKTIIVSFSF